MGPLPKKCKICVKRKVGVTDRQSLGRIKEPMSVEPMRKRKRSALKAEPMRLTWV